MALFNGTETADTLIGENQNDTISGFGGNDILVGAGGDDVINGDAGEDVLAGESGNNTLHGGDGLDIADYRSADFGIEGDLERGTVSNGYGGTDTLFSIEDLMGSEYGDRLAGDNLANFLRGGSGDDQILGRGGNDWLIGDAGNDTFDGGDGIDYLSYYNAANGVSVDMAEGVTFNDGEGYSDRFSSIEELSGSNNGDDTLLGDDNGNWIAGRIGHDSIEGRAGDDSLIGGAGNDTLRGGDGYDDANYFNSGGRVIADLRDGTAQDGEGTRDKLFGIEGLVGSDVAGDILRGDKQDNGFHGAGGDDQIFGRGGDDRLRGAAGNDTLHGGKGDDEAYYYRDGAGVNVDLRSGVAQDGQGGTDRLISIEKVYGSDIGNDTIYGNKGENSLYGAGGDDWLHGMGGRDFVVGDAGNDTLNGGAGQDTVSYYDAATGAVVDLAAGTAKDGEGGTDTLHNFEIVGGSNAGDDHISGDRKSNGIWGNGGNDTLIGRGGDDWLWGGAGNDMLRAGGGDDRMSASPGSDTLNGGSGRDEVTFDRALREQEDDGSVIVVNLTRGVGYSTSELSTDRTKLISVEDVLGSYYEDDYDEYREMDLSMRVLGNAEANRLVGGANNDTLKGGAGNDTLEGAAGDDTLSGQRGADHFVFSTEFTNDWGTDTIMDFRTKGTEEKIVIDSNTEAGTFAAFQGAARQVGNNVVYDLGDDGSNVIVIRDVLLDDLRDNDFLFS